MEPKSILPTWIPQHSGAIHARVLGNTVGAEEAAVRPATDADAFWIHQPAVGAHPRYGCLHVKYVLERGGGGIRVRYGWMGYCESG